MGPRFRLTKKQLWSWIEEKSSYCDPCLIGIDGGGVSGKTTFGKKLQEKIPGSQIVRMDDFYLPEEIPIGSKSPIGGNFDWARLRDDVLLPIREGFAGTYQAFDWEEKLLHGKTKRVDPKGVIIIEGIYSIRKELEEFFDIKIWVHCSLETRLARGIERDGEGMRETWEKDWIPREELYMQTHKPQSRSDLILSGDDEPKSGGYWCLNREKIVLEK